MVVFLVDRIRTLPDFDSLQLREVLAQVAPVHRRARPTAGRLEVIMLGGLGLIHAQRVKLLFQFLLLGDFGFHVRGLIHKELHFLAAGGRKTGISEGHCRRSLRRDKVPTSLTPMASISRSGSGFGRNPRVNKVCPQVGSRDWSRS